MSTGNAPDLIDLRADPAGWESVVRPADHSPLHLLVARVASEMEGLADRVVQRIIENVEEYGQVSPARRGELWWASLRNLQAIMICIAEGRGFGREELALRKAVASRAVGRDISLSAVIRAFRLGYLELWDTATATAGLLGRETEAALLANASTMWTSLDQLSSAITESYTEETAAQALQEHRRLMGFIEAMRGLPGSLPELRRRAREFGLDPDESVVLAAYRGHGVSPADPRVITLDLADRSLALVSGGDLGPADEQSLAEMLSEAGARHVGVGTVRHGLQHAGQSVDEADRAHATAQALARPTVVFRSDWLACLVVGAADELRDLLAPTIDAIAEEGVDEALSAYLEADGKLAAAGRELHVHPNTVAYRLEGLARRTGLDVRTSLGGAEALAIGWIRQASR